MYAPLPAPQHVEARHAVPVFLSLRLGRFLLLLHRSLNGFAEFGNCRHIGRMQRILGNVAPNRSALERSSARAVHVNKKRVFRGTHLTTKARGSLAGGGCVESGGRPCWTPTWMPLSLGTTTTGRSFVGSPLTRRLNNFPVALAHGDDQLERQRGDFLRGRRGPDRPKPFSSRPACS
jgi:hypothetical protein